jgi:hypothetical protein
MTTIEDIVEEERTAYLSTRPEILINNDRATLYRRDLLSSCCSLMSPPSEPVWPPVAATAEWIRLSEIVDVKCLLTRVGRIRNLLLDLELNRSMGADVRSTIRMTLMLRISI